MKTPLPPRPIDPEATLDEALRAYPLRPTPPGLARAVLARVRGYPARPRFRLSWLDFALVGLGAAMVGLGLLLVRVLATPEQVVRAQNALSVLLVGGGPQWAGLLLAALAGAGLVAVGLLVAAGVALASGGRR